MKKVYSTYEIKIYSNELKIYQLSSHTWHSKNNT